MNNQNFISLYRQLNRDTLSRDYLATCYASDVQFSDPLHRIKGIDALLDYFSALYSNVSDIRFDFHSSYEQGNQSLLRWTMVFRHPSLNGGNEIEVEGCSELFWQSGKIVKHQDFFDAGALLYEHVPLLGWAIRKLKGRMA